MNASPPPLLALALVLASAASARDVPETPSAEPAPPPRIVDGGIPAAVSLLDAPDEGSAAPESGEELLAQCAARMPAERVLLKG